MPDKDYPSIQSATHPRTGEVISVGDMVTGYNPGVWIVTEILDRSVPPPASYGRDKPANPLIQMDIVLDAAYTKPRKKRIGNRCDIGFCSLVTVEDLERWRDDIIEQRNIGIQLFLERVRKQMEPCQKVSE